MYIAGFIFLLLGGLLIRKIWRSEKKWVQSTEPFPVLWRKVLVEQVVFYNSLNETERALFESRIQEFLLNCRITGVGVDIDDTDKVLVAASAIIPIHAFPEWRYWNLFEVLIYPKSFDENFAFDGVAKPILGMVGTGYMDGKMILSREALRSGFKNESDKRNTAIHEFVHLIDKMDNTIDGVPQVLLDKQYVLPWMDLMKQETQRMLANQSDIDLYGATKPEEFLAVISEYFFERPQMLEQKHEALYKMLASMFNHDLAERRLVKPKQSIERNDPCVCNSGKKFKKCCGKVHYG